MFDVIIIGGGPAGVSAGLYIARAGMKCLIIENGAGALAKAHRIENYYGVAAGGGELYEQGLQQVRQLGVKVVRGEAVSIDYYGSFAVRCVDMEQPFQGTALLLATGMQQAAPPIKGLAELEGKGVSYCAVCDGFFFKNKRVAVLGSGAYAVHEAEYLSHLARETVVLTHGDDVRIVADAGLKAVSTAIEEIKGNERLEKVIFKDGTALEMDGLFVAQGTAGTGAVAKKLGLEMNGNFIRVGIDGSTALPGLFAAGDCTGGMLQVAKAVYEGASAGTAIINYVRKQKKA